MASSIQGRRKVRWHVAIPREVIAEYSGVQIGDYYSDPETMLNTQRKSRKTFRELYGLSSEVGGVDMSTYVNASTWGLQVVFPEDNVPMIKGRLITDIRQVDKLKPSKDLMTAGLIPRYLKFQQYMRCELGWKEPEPRVGGSGTQGPFTTAVLLRGEGLFTDLYGDPKRVHKLLQMIMENSINLMQLYAHMSNVTSIESMGMTDDFGGMVSPAQYEEFVLPYNKYLYETFGKRDRSLHSELLRRGHLKYLTEMGITSFDPGNDQYLTIEDIKAEISIPFTWNIKPYEYLLIGTRETIRAAYKDAVERGASSIMTELCCGIPRENVQAFIEVAREYE